MTRSILPVTLVGLCLGLYGCLQKDTASTIYLKQDGSIEWVVLESNVRSDERDAATRAREEADYFNAVTSNHHPAAEAFRALGALKVRTSFVRRARPYAALVEGEFDSLTGAVGRWLAACGVLHDIHETRDGATTTWVLRMYVEPWIHDGAEPTPVDEDVCDAAGGLASGELRVTLDKGRFTEWTGFRPRSPDTDTVVVDDDAIEEAATDEAIEANGGWLVLSFSWTTATTLQRVVAKRSHPPQAITAQDSIEPGAEPFVIRGDIRSKGVR